jgi:hypothetical protein
LDGTDGNYAIKTALHNDRLRAQINTTLQAIESDGRLSNMRKHWFSKPKLKLASNGHRASAEPF